MTLSESVLKQIDNVFIEHVEECTETVKAQEQVIDTRITLADLKELANFLL